MLRLEGWRAGPSTEASAGQPAALSAATLCEAFQTTAAERPDAVALRTPGDGVSITWAEYAERVPRIAAGLAEPRRRARRHGRADAHQPARSSTSPTPARCTSARPPFSVYNTSTPEQVEYLFGNAAQPGGDHRAGVPAGRARGAAAVAGARAHRARSTATRTARSRSTQLEEMGDVELRLRGGVARGRARRRRDADLHVGHDRPAEGRAAHAPQPDGRDPRRGGPPPDRAGRPDHLVPAVARTSPTAGPRTTSRSMVFGFTLTCIADPRTVVQHLPEVRPTAWGSVPRIWEKMKAALEAQGVTDPAALPEEHRAAIREKLGLDQCAWLVVGAAPTPVEVLEYFAALGLPICELWGMSETSSCATINPPGPHQGRHLRPAAAGRRAEARRRRRAARARRDRDEGLPQRPREDAPRRSTTTAGCTPATSPRSTTTAT